MQTLINLTLDNLKVRSAMEVLGLLEKKIEGLVLLTKKLQEEKDHLALENKELRDLNESLREQMVSLEDSLLKSSEGLSEEKKLTKMVVDGLIKSIDSLIENESNHGEKEV